MMSSLEPDPTTVEACRRSGPKRPRVCAGCGLKQTARRIFRCVGCQKYQVHTEPKVVGYKGGWVGGRLVGMDLSQIELRVTALLRGDDGEEEKEETNPSGVWAVE